MQELFRKILWFDKRLKFDIDFFECLQPQRIVSRHHRYKSGVFYSEKCKRDIQYESGIELNFIKKLEKAKEVIFYFEQPIKIRYKRGRKNETYTPDFGVYLKSKEFVLVEVKDLPGMLENRVQMKTEGLLEYCSRKGFGLLLTDGKHTFDKLLKTKINRKLEKELSAAVEHSVLRKDACTEIIKCCNASQWELYKSIIRLNLRFRTYPMKVQKENKNDIFREIFIYKKRYNDLRLERATVLFKKDRPEKF